MLAALGALALESVALIFVTPLSAVAAPAAPAWFMPIGVFIEELFSLLLIGKLLQNSSDKKNIFTRALCFGLGFALPEILLNFADNPRLSQEILLSYLGLLLIHSATAGIFGYYFSKKIGFRAVIFFFFLLALFTHLAFNLLVLFSLSFWLILGLPLFVIFLCFLALKMPPAKASLPSQKN